MVITREDINLLGNCSDMRTLITKELQSELSLIRYCYNEKDSDCDKLVFNDDAFSALIDELKHVLYGKRVSIEAFEDCLLRKNFDSKDLDYIEGVLSNVPGFLMMNKTITFRGENFVAPIPPNQNPVNHEEIMKKNLGNK